MIFRSKPTKDAANCRPNDSPPKSRRNLLKSLFLASLGVRKALSKVPEIIRRRVSTRPNIMLSFVERLGIADPETWTIQLKSTFAATHRFDAVRDVFLHEVAHLWASVYPEGERETGHGAIFRSMCELLGADPHATNKNSPFFSPECKNLADSTDPQDMLRAKVQKLLALAQSPYPEEARSAASKASALITRHNLTLIEEDRERSFTSRFMCDRQEAPASSDRRFKYSSTVFLCRDRLGFYVGRLQEMRGQRSRDVRAAARHRVCLVCL